MTEALAKIERTHWLCSVCLKPGTCCRRFLLPPDEGDEDPVIPPTYWKDSLFEDGNASLEAAGLPFKVGGIEKEYQCKNGAYVKAWYYCPMVTPEGRCSIYGERPSTCWSFRPMSDSLCVFWRPDAP